MKETLIALSLAAFALVAAQSVQNRALLVSAIFFVLLAAVVRHLLSRETPESRAHQQAVTVESSLGEHRVSFMVGSFFVEFHHTAGGWETYYVDEREVMRIRNLDLSGIRTITLPSGDALVLTLHSPFRISARIGQTILYENLLDGAFRRRLAKALPPAILLGIVLGSLGLLLGPCMSQ